MKRNIKKKYKLPESIVNTQMEYNTIRNEMMNAIVACDNYKIAMYTISTAVLCVAFELRSPVLCLIPYIVIFAFQWAISSKNENLIVMGAYVAVYFEKGHGWENDNIELKHVMRTGGLHNKPNSTLSRLLGRISSVQLGLLCSVASGIYSIVRLCFSSSYLDRIEPGICLLLAVFLYIIIRIQTKDVLTLGKRKKAYIDNLRNQRLNIDSKGKNLVRDRDIFVPKLSKNEEEIMGVFWDTKRILSIKDLTRYCRNLTLQENCLMVILRLLEEKKMLILVGSKTKKVQRFRCTMSREEYYARLSYSCGVDRRKFMEEICKINNI